MKWTKSGFDGFRKGSFGNGGQNLYVTANGTLQRIFNFDVNGDGKINNRDMLELKKLQQAQS